MQIEMFTDSGAPTPEATSAACSAAAFDKVDAGRLRRLTEQEALLFPDGFIADEIVYRLQGLGIKVDYFSIRPRVTELKQAGVLVSTGRRRLNKKGNTCAILRHKQFQEEI